MSQEQCTSTLDVLEQRPDLLRFTLQITKTLLQAAVVAATHTAYGGGIAAGVAQEQARAAAVLG